jgi:hypothetical protein
MEVDLRCDDCGCSFSKKHDLATHLKGSKHAAVIESQRARNDLRELTLAKEQKAEARKLDLLPKLQGHFRFVAFSFDDRNITSL